MVTKKKLNVHGNVIGKLVFLPRARSIIYLIIAEKYMETLTGA
jgi:hypothetical protein